MAEVTRIANGETAVAAIIQLLNEAYARTVVCVPETKSAVLGLVVALEAAGFTVYTLRRRIKLITPKQPMRESPKWSLPSPKRAVVYKTTAAWKNVSALRSPRCISGCS